MSYGKQELILPVVIDQAESEARHTQKLFGDSNLYVCATADQCSNVVRDATRLSFADSRSFRVRLQDDAEQSTPVTLAVDGSSIHLLKTEQWRTSICIENGALLHDMDRGADVSPPES